MLHKKIGQKYIRSIIIVVVFVIFASNVCIKVHISFHIIIKYYNFLFIYCTGFQCNVVIHTVKH